MNAREAAEKIVATYPDDLYGCERGIAETIQQAIDEATAELREDAEGVIDKLDNFSRPCCSDTRTFGICDCCNKYNSIIKKLVWDFRSKYPEETT